MRLIDADRLKPDRMTDKGLAISQSQIAKAPTVNAIPIEVLDKIRTEIEQLPRYGAKFPNRYLTVHVDIYEVLKIIDKYRGE